MKLSTIVAQFMEITSFCSFRWQPYAALDRQKTNRNTVLYYCILCRHLVWLSLSLELIQNTIVTSLDEVEQMVCVVYYKLQFINHMQH